MAYCRNCYKELSFGETVCKGCGKSIDKPLFKLPDEIIRQNENTPINTDVPQNAAPDAKKTSVEKVKCKNCGTEYDSSKSSCPKCFSNESEPIYKGTVDQAISKAESKSKTVFNSKEDRAKAVGVLSVIFAILFLIYVFKHIQFSNSVDEYRKKIHENKTATTTAAVKSNEDRAWDCAVQAVKDNIISPSTASFQRKRILKMNKTDGSECYKVYGSVDAQNRMGAMVRQYFETNITLLEGDKFNYTIPSFSDYDTSQFTD